MNSIHTNYQVNFQARGGKKTVKALTDVFEKQQLNKKVFDLPKLKCVCVCGKPSEQSIKNMKEGIIDIIR